MNKENKLNNFNSEFIKKNKILFSNNFRCNTTFYELHKKYDNFSNEKLNYLSIKAKIAGRIITKRIMGKASFVTIQDINGKIQLYITENNLPLGIYSNFFKKWNISDIVGVHGILFKTKTGELSLKCYKLFFIKKSKKKLPDKYHGLINQEICYRQRYLDLISNNKSRKIFKIRFKLIQEIRNFMIKKKFIEVETPMIHNIPGGASARPFITHHNTLNIDLYLRIAPELYLKRLLIGGFTKIFEINRSFRNEGISLKHNPEFTMMEAYVSYSNYNDAMNLIQNLLKKVVKKIFNTNFIKNKNEIFDFSKPFKKISMQKSICLYNKNIKLNDLFSLKKLKIISKSLDINIQKNWGLGKIQTEIFEKTVENNLIQPTFIVDYPLEVSPLAKKNDKNEFFAERFEFFLGGQEIGNGFSELNDADEQKYRFKEQIIKKNFTENYFLYDKDYITALEYGLPPSSGIGIGIDRLIMLLTNSNNIRDVILFPTLKPNS
ncbi:lysine--tRNA ligase [Sodalis-like secondary symbiont of Drepanosiphum platanoidis]|uniref:lysine--tRNA ligase n=1 Tax=Sodalis-like secondary symbiont of Drepanosiphum platanoidis TaxID=2994493 RepID=UPI003464B626